MTELIKRTKYLAQLLAETNHINCYFSSLLFLGLNPRHADVYAD